MHSSSIIIIIYLGLRLIEPKFQNISIGDLQIQTLSGPLADIGTGNDYELVLVSVSILFCNTFSKINILKHIY